MDLAPVSKAIAGMIASIAAAWAVALFGFEIPADLIDWGTATLSTLIAGGLGFLITYVSPKNKT